MLHGVASSALETCLIVFCGFTIAFSQAAQPDDAAKEAIGKAQAAYQKKDYVLAKRELESALSIRKDLAEPHLLLGMIAWQEGKVDDAIKSVKEAIKYQPNYPDAHYVMGKLYFNKRDFKRAQEEANLASGQGSKLAILLLGDIALAQEQYEPAVKFFEQVLTQLPQNSEVTNETRIKIEAVKNQIEFQANKGNKDFQTPKISARGPIPRPVPFRQVTIKLAGIFTEQGRFKTFFVIHASDQQMLETFLQYVTEIQYTPAKKNGVPLPIWRSVDYSTSSSIQVIQ